MDDRKELDTFDLKVDTTKFKSTTARLLVAFTQCLCKAYGLPSDNPALIRAAIVSTSFAQSSEKVISLSDSFEIQAVTREILDTLKATQTSAAKSVHEMYGPNAEAALNHSAELETSENTFKTTLSEERQKAIDALESILKIVASADNPVEKARSQEILNQMQTLNTISEKLDKALDTIEKARHKSDEQLKKIGITMLNATTPTSQESNAREILKPRNN